RGSPRGREPIRAAHDFVLGAIELAVARRLRARRGELLRRIGGRVACALAKKIAGLRRPTERKLRRGRAAPHRGLRVTPGFRGGWRAPRRAAARGLRLPTDARRLDAPAV